MMLLLIPATANAQQTESTASKINAANELVRQQKTTEAIDAYNQIDSAADPGSQYQLDYNLAVAHYRNSDYTAAISLFGETSKSLDRKLAVSSRHNLGNCHYAQALPLVESEPDAAIKQLQKSIVHFRSALRLDRSNAASRSNIELAQKLIKQIQQEQEQEQRTKTTRLNPRNPTKDQNRNLKPLTNQATNLTNHQNRQTTKRKINAPKNATNRTGNSLIQKPPKTNNRLTRPVSNQPTNRNSLLPNSWLAI